MNTILNILNISSLSENTNMRVFSIASSLIFSMLYTVYYPPCTVHPIGYTVYYPPYIVHFVVYTILYTLRCILYTLCHIIYTLYCLLCTTHPILYIPSCTTLYSTPTQSAAFKSRSLLLSKHVLAQLSLLFQITVFTTNFMSTAERFSVVRLLL